MLFVTLNLFKNTIFEILDLKQETYFLGFSRIYIFKIKIVRLNKSDTLRCIQSSAKQSTFYVMTSFRCCTHPTCWHKEIEKEKPNIILINLPCTSTEPTDTNTNIFVTVSRSYIRHPLLKQRHCLMIGAIKVCYVLEIKYKTKSQTKIPF